MTARGYEQDEALRVLKERIRRLELKEARNRPGSGVSVEDPGGFFGGPGPLTLEEVLALIGAGLAPGAFLTVIGGGKGTVQALGTLGATETIDLANANYFAGTLNANCTVTFTTTVDTAERWFTLELIEDGTGGWTVTWPGSVTWLGGSTPAHTTTAGTTTIYAFFTRNGGTTWIGGQLGAGGAAFATPAIVLGTAAAAGAAATVIRSDATIVAFDATVPANVTATAATGSAAVAARRDHVHALADTAGHYELLMAGGISSPPEPLENGTGDDWLYAWVPG